MKKKNKLLSDSIFLTVGNYVIKMKGLLFMPVIINAVGLANYGIFVQISVNLSMIHPFCTMALGEGFKRFTSKTDENERELLARDFWTVMLPSIALSILGALAVFFTAPIIGIQLFKELSPDVLLAIRLSSLMVVERVVWEQLNNYLLGRKSFKQNTLLSLLYKFVPYLGMVAGFVWYGSMAMAFGLFLVLESVLVLALFVRIVRKLPFCLPDLQVLRMFFKYSWALTLSQFEGSLLAKVDRYFISYFMGPAAVGAYNIIYSVVSFLDDLSLPFRRYYSTYLPKIWDSGDMSEALSQIRTGIRYFYTISWIGLCAMTLGLGSLMSLLLGDRSPDIESFHLVVVVTGAGIVAEGVKRFYNQLINLRRKNHFQVIFQLLAVAINMALNYFLVPIWGLLGAGFATLIAYGLIVTLNAQVFRLEAGSHYYWKLLLGTVLGIPAIIIAIKWPTDDLLNTTFRVVGFLAIYVLLAFKIGLFQVSELLAILGRKPNAA